MAYILEQYSITFGWVMTGTTSMAIALSILVKVFTFGTPIDGWEEVEKENIGIAILIASVIMGTASVIGLTIMPRLHIEKQS